MTAHEAALAAAAIAAADMAAADKAQALDAAKMAADAAQVVALDAAKMAADAAQVVALDAAKMAADAAQVVALDAAKMAADAAQVVALDAAKVIADAAQVVALDAAKMAADAAQVVALADAKVIADADLKLVQDELDALKRTDAAKDAVAQAGAKSEMAAEVLKALALSSGALPGITVAASSNSRFTAEAAGYTMSGTPEGISGFRGAILTKDGAEARVYTNTENAAATPIGGIYQSTSLAGEPARYSVIAAPTPAGQQIPWSVVKRDDAVVTTTSYCQKLVTVVFRRRVRSAFLRP